MSQSPAKPDGDFIQLVGYLVFSCCFIIAFSKADLCGLTKTKYKKEETLFGKNISKTIWNARS